MKPAIELQSISKTFGETRALDQVTSRVEQGQMVALIGPSGSGKSTLLRAIAGLETVDKTNASSILVDGTIIQYEGRLASNVRRIRLGIGFIFQQFHLIGRLSVMRNVLVGALGSIPLWRGSLGYFTWDEKRRAMNALKRVGLQDLAHQRASTLSGGQQQRVAIARSLMQQAQVILADEPIASLDPKSAKTVMKQLRKLNKKDGKTVIVTLHQVDYARKYCKRIIALVEGRIAFDGKPEELSDKVLRDLYGTTLSDDDELDLDNEHVNLIPRLATFQKSDMFAAA